MPRPSLPLLLLTAVLTLGSTPVALAATTPAHERADVPPRALGLSKVTASGTATPTGTRVTTTFTVRNRTAKPVPASTARLFLVSQDGSRTFGLEEASVPRLTPGETRRITRTKAPSLSAAAGQYRVRVCLAPRPGGACLTTTAATVRIAPPRLVATPDSVGFGDTEAGTQAASRRVVVRNEGQSVTGDLTVAVTGADADAFVVTGTTCTESLEPGRTCTVDLGFAPTSAGAKTASLDVTGARPGAATSVALTGDAIPAPAPAALAIDPTTSDFGSVDLGGSVTRTFTVTNTGGVASGPVAALLDRPAPFTITASTCDAPLPAQGTCTVDVQFTSMAPVTASATLTVTGTPGGTASATLTGTGRQVGARLSISPGSHDFGTVPAGQQSAPQAFTVTNTGDTETGPLTTLIGPPGGVQQFFVTANTCTSLAPRASCAVTIVYRPSSLAVIADGFVGVADFRTGAATPLTRLAGRTG